MRLGSTALGMPLASPLSPVAREQDRACLTTRPVRWTAARPVLSPALIQRSGIRRWNGWTRPSACGSSRRAALAGCAYSSERGPAVLPVSYQLDEGTIVFRTPLDSPTDESLRTGIEGAYYKVAFEIDEISRDGKEGWFVFIQGAARHEDSGDDRASAWAPDAQPSAGRRRLHFLRITPSLITGRRLRRD